MDDISSLIGKKSTPSAAQINTASSSKPSLLSDTKASSQFSKKMEEMEIEQKERMAQVQASMLGLDYINLDKFPIGPEALKLLSKEEALSHQVIPFYRAANEIRLAAVRPGTPEILEIVQRLKDKEHVEVKLYLVSEYSFSLAFKQYENLPILKEVVEGVQITEADLAKYQKEVKVITDLQNIIEGVNVTDIVTAVVALGLQMRASDIHIETEEDDVKIRYRIDGVLQDAASLPHSAFTRISNRLKLLSKLKLNVSNTPQDGRFTIVLTDDKIDVRVSVLPTTFGESIVMRILKASAAGIDFESLGLRGAAFERLLKEITKPNGMIITTGPTGSGKTTTLYSILIKLNTEETKIITMEDPVEYKLKGINQSQVDKSRGYDFASGLRSILRQDPDIIMVGEIRDFETADTAINAALTGHLVISTLHTNSASGAIPRFLSMGVKPFLLTPALNAIIGQRLVRRICPDCIEADTLDEATLKQVDEVLAKIPDAEFGEITGRTAAEITWKKGGGCEACHGIGYKGRVGIYEIMTMTKEIEKLISSENISEYAVQEVAEKEGMVSMVGDGILKAAAGTTTIEEVFRVAKSLE